MKKLCTLLFAILVGTCSLFAYDVKIGDLYYNLNTENKTAEVTYIWNNSQWGYNYGWTITTADIPASINYYGYSYSVTSIGDHAFSNQKKLTSITIPNSVTSIGSYAFSSCSGLTSIDIPNSVTSIGNYAFSSCSGLTSIDIPNSVTNIGKNAFYGCTGLTSITIGNSVTSIGDKAFYNCSGLTSIDIPNSVTSIGNSSFFSCEGLTSIEIPNSVTSIGDSTFIFCFGLTSMTIGNSVTSIGKCAFYYCSSLTSIEIPNSVTSIGEKAFRYCSSLPVIDNIRYADTYLVDVVDKTLSSYTIKDGTRWIGTSAFQDCTGLTFVTIPNSVTSIGENAFYGCTGLTSVTIPNSVTSIGEWTFGDCTSLTSVFWNARNCNACKFGNQVESFTFGDKVEVIPASLCYNMDKLEEIIIPNSVTSIGEKVFKGCSNLTTAIWNAKKCQGFDSSSTPFYYYDPKNKDDNYDLCKQITSFTFGDEVEYIPDYLCQNMTNLGSITIPNSVKEIGDYAFYNCVALRTVNMGNQVQSIGAHAFDNCTRVNALDLPATLTYIGVDAFKNTPFITSTGEWEDGIHYIGTCIIGTNPDEIIANPILRKGTTAIYQSAFKYCNKIISITLPDAITVIPDSAFFSCKNLISIEIPNSVTSIGWKAFEYCSSLNSFKIPNSITSIESNTFSNCTGLTSIEIPNSVTRIGQWAFAYCYSLTSIEIPNSVTRIEMEAFNHCSGLTSIYIPNSVTWIGQYAFDGCSGLTSISIGNSVTWIGDHAFRGCSSLTSVIWNIKTYEDFNESSTPFYYYDKYNKKVDYDLRNQIKSFAFGNEVEHIPSYLCHNMTNLTSIEIPNSVTSIGAKTFKGCSSLTTVIWNAKICQNFNKSSTPFYYYDTSYKDDNFDLRKQIKIFAFGNEVEHIPSYLCSNMNKMETITIPNSVTSIGYSAFSYCTNVSAAHLGNNVKDIGSLAFSGCSGLKEITLGHAIESIGDNAFDKCPNVMTIYSYLETPPAINSTVFAGFGTYKGVDLYIPEGAKANYEAMDYWKDFYIIEGLPDIIDNKLHYTLNEETQTATLITSSLAELKPVIDGELIIPDTVVSNGKTYVVTAIGNNVFKDNSTITTVIIPSTVTQIGDSAFYGSSITSVVIGGTETPVSYNSAARRIVTEGICCSIGAYAFANCKKLTEIYFPECVSSIGEGAFKDCSALTTINSKMQNPPVIDETVFEGCGDLGNIALMVPEGSEETYKNMAVWKEFLFNTSLKTYTITFVNWDGAELLKLADVQEGTLPVYTAELPTRPEDDEFTYSFIGWTPEIVPASEDATYTAAYEATPKAEGIKDVYIDNIVTQKLLHNGQILILRGDKTYTLTGQEVK